MNEPVEGQFSNLWQRAKRTAVEYLAVFIAAWGFVFGVIGCLIGILSMWVAYDANQNAKVARLELQAYIRERSHVQQTLQNGDRLQRGDNGSDNERSPTDSESPDHR